MLCWQIGTIVSQEWVEVMLCWQIGTIVSQEAARQLKRVSMELGGKSPAIVFADADSE